MVFTNPPALQKLVGSLPPCHEGSSRVRKLAKLSVMNGISASHFKNDNVEKPQPPAQSLTCVLVFKFEGQVLFVFPLVEQSATK